MESIRFEDCGEPAQVLKCVETERPRPGRGQVLVRMLASPINPSDLMFVRGRYTTMANLPATPGFEGVGVVEECGGGLRGRLFLGKRVVVLNRQGGNWADYTLIPSEQVIPISRQLSDDQAATFFVNPATAWIMTQEVLKISRNAWLMQTAAASTLGRMVIRLGQHCGFRTFNVVRRKDQAEQLSQLGADHVQIFDGDADSAAELRKAWQTVTSTSGVRFAVDPVGGATGSAVVECLGERGHLLQYGTLSNQPVSFSPRTLMTVGAQVEGFWLGNFMNSVSLPCKLLLIRRITNLIRDGILSSEVRATFSLSQIGTAVTAAEEKARTGKILLRMNAT